MKKRAIVLGVAISGQGAIAWLLREGFDVVAIDRQKKEVPQGVAFIQEGSPFSFQKGDLLVLSPGIPLSHPLVQQAKKEGVKITGELELALLGLNNKILAITGANGKTTATLMCQHLLQSSGVDAVAFGNIGASLAEATDLKGKVIVLEVSSFQLETLASPRFDGAAILNIAPDHLERHHTLEEYARVKFSIQNELKKDAKLFITKEIYEKYKYMINKPVVLYDQLEIEGDLSIHEELLIHDALNAKAALLLAQLINPAISNLKALQNFKKPEHRLELVDSKNDILYINDSKATNVHAALAALITQNRPIIALFGGYDKGESFKPLIDVCEGRVKKAYLFGKSSARLLEELKDCVPCEKVENLEEATRLACQMATRGDCVLLTPACSSYDSFKNFEDRGRHFKKWVMKYVRENTQ